MDPERNNDPFIAMMKENFRTAARTGELASVRSMHNSPEAEAQFKQNVTEFLSSEGFSAEQIAKVFPK